MAGGSVSGLVSGLDTATIISQLMQVEAATADHAQDQAVHREVDGQHPPGHQREVRRARPPRRTTSPTPPPGRPTTATSSSTQVPGATASASAVPGTLQPHRPEDGDRLPDGVQQHSGLRRRGHHRGYHGPARQARTARPRSTSRPPTGRSPGWSTHQRQERRRHGGRGKVADTATGCASVSTTTGLASDFALTNPDGSSSWEERRPRRAGRGYQRRHRHRSLLDQHVHRPHAGPGHHHQARHRRRHPVDVDVARDSAGVQASLQSLVDGANEILIHHRRPLRLRPGQEDVRSPRRRLGDAGTCGTKVLDTVTRTADGTSMPDLGLQTDRSGKIVFDGAKFATAYAADPAGVSQKLGATGTRRRTRLRRAARRRSASWPATPPPGR